MAKYTPNTKDELIELIQDESIHLGDIDTSNIADMSGLFVDINRNDFSGIEEWNVSNVEDMYGMFYNCVNFNQDLSSWDVSNVENMGGMFYYCKSFNQDLSSWDVSNVKNMYGMFYKCKTFNQNLSSWDVSNVENMEDMFKGANITKEQAFHKLTAKDILKMFEQLDTKEAIKFIFAYQGFSCQDGEDWITDPNNPYIEKMAEYYVANERKWKHCDGFINSELIDYIQSEFHQSLGTDDIDEAIEKISKPFEEQFEEKKIQTTMRR